MIEFEIHTLESAPEDSSELLSKTKAKYGFIPNLLGVLAESPVALRAYLSLGQLLEQSSFTPVEQQVILLGISFENRCDYCMAAHSTVAKIQRVPRDVVAALRQGQPIGNPRLQSLAQFTRDVVRNRGWLPEETVESFLLAGFTKAQLLEVIVAVAMKTLSNYVNHIAETPLDVAFESSVWTSPESHRSDQLPAASR